MLQVAGLLTNATYRLLCRGERRKNKKKKKKQSKYSGKWKAMGDYCRERGRASLLDYFMAFPFVLLKELNES
jgi:hypothetical protein